MCLSPSCVRSANNRHNRRSSCVLASVDFATHDTRLSHQRIGITAAMHLHATRRREAGSEFLSDRRRRVARVRRRRDRRPIDSRIKAQGAQRSVERYSRSSAHVTALAAPCKNLSSPFRSRSRRNVRPVPTVDLTVLAHLIRTVSRHRALASPVPDRERRLPPRSPPSPRPTRRSRPERTAHYGSKSVLLRTLLAAESAKTAGFGVPNSVPKWRARRDSNSRPSESKSAGYLNNFNGWSELSRPVLSLTTLGNFARSECGPVL